MELTIEDKAILAHVVLNPDVWVDHTLKTVGEQAVMAKIERWRPHYEAEKIKPDYKNRVERDTAEEANKPIPDPNIPILANLVAIDLKTIRALRTGETDYLKKYEEEAQIERKKLKY
jgi:hypothetical protein